MPSKLKSDTARANGAKSKGPKTAETRQKSSCNSLKHGLTARHNLLLACGDPALFQRVLDEYVALYQPSNPIERDLVEEMISAKWRIRRLRTMKVALMDYEMANQEEEIEKTLTEFDSGIHMAISFTALTDGSRSLSLLSRHESRLHRIHHRAHQMFLELRRAMAEGQLTTPLAPVSREPPPPASPNETSKSEAGQPAAPAAGDCQHPTSKIQNPPLGCRGQKKFKNEEPTARSALRKIRNHRKLKGAPLGPKRAPALLPQAPSYFRKT